MRGVSIIGMGGMFLRGGGRRVRVMRGREGGRGNGGGGGRGRGRGRGCIIDCEGGFICLGLRLGFVFGSFGYGIGMVWLL